MKKVFTTLAFVLAFVLSMTMITACADNRICSRLCTLDDHDHRLCGQHR